VFPEGACEVSTEVNGVDEHWWLTAPALLREIEGRGFVSGATGFYRLGDAVLQVSVDDPTLLEIFAPLYADCAISRPAAAGVPAVRCTIQRSYEPPLVVLTFQEGAPPDPAAAAFNLLRPTQAIPPFTVSDSPTPGWRLAGGVNGPVLVARDAHVLLHPKLIPPEFLVEYLVGITLGAQPWTLPIHGASVQMGKAGVMLVGASRAGKTTTSLHLAVRGHTLLGDEIALIRLATGEVVPFRRSVNVRLGPQGRELAVMLGRSAAANGTSSTAAWAGPHRITELFPGRYAGPVPLRAAFFLGGFADQPSLEPFQLSLDRDDVVGWITTPEIAYCSWGLAPARRAFRLVVLKQVLSRIPCWLLKLGQPRATAELIERTMEGLSC
jgi:hypothetical protein